MLASFIYSTKAALSHWQQQLADFLTYHFLHRQLKTPFGYAFLALSASFVAVVGAKFGVMAVVILLGLFLGLAVFLACLLHPPSALFFSIIFSFFIIYCYRYLLVYYPHLSGVPLGAVVDALLVVGFVAVFLDQSYRQGKDLSFIKNPITYVYVLYMLFLVVEFFNPNMEVALGYISFMRRMFTLLSCYVVVLYIFKDKRFLKNFIRVWLALALLAALYGCSQEWFGYMPMESDWINQMVATEGRNPYFHDGTLRHFSFFSDPTVFGMFMATSGLFCLVLMTGPFGTATKFKLSLNQHVSVLRLGLFRHPYRLRDGARRFVALRADDHHQAKYAHFCGSGRLRTMLRVVCPYLQQPHDQPNSYRLYWFRRCLTQPTQPQAQHRATIGVQISPGRRCRK